MADDVAKLETLPEREMRELTDYYQTIAQRHWICFNAHIDAGFTDDQALQFALSEWIDEQQ